MDIAEISGTVRVKPRNLWCPGKLLLRMVPLRFNIYSAIVFDYPAKIQKISPILAEFFRTNKGFFADAFDQQRNKAIKTVCVIDRNQKMDVAIKQIGRGTNGGTQW